MIDLIFIAGCSTPGVHPKTTAAIIQHESSFNSYAVNANGYNGSALSFADNNESIIRQAEELHGLKVSIDIGLMQINSSNFGAYRLTVRDAFDPCTNIRVGTAILKRFYDQAAAEIGPGQEALKAALSAYNTGNHVSGFQNGYVAKYYGKTVSYKSNPYTASIEQTTALPRTQKRRNPFNASMIPPNRVENNMEEEADEKRVTGSKAEEKIF